MDIILGQVVLIQRRIGSTPHGLYLKDEELIKAIKKANKIKSPKKSDVFQD